MSTDRGDYTAGLRALADILDANPDLPLPYHGRATQLLWIQTGDEQRQREVAQTFARAIPGRVEKRDRGPDFDIIGKVEGLSVGVIVSREAVCTRVVKGTREVTKEVADPEALAAVPTVTVTETVEDIEWICEPLLADRAVSA